jgi:hypothetical protein
MHRRREFMGHLPQRGACAFGENYGTVRCDVLDSVELGYLGLTMFAHGNG